MFLAQSALCSIIFQVPSFQDYLISNVFNGRRDEDSLRIAVPPADLLQRVVLLIGLLLSQGAPLPVLLYEVLLYGEDCSAAGCCSATRCVLTRCVLTRCCTAAGRRAAARCCSAAGCCAAAGCCSATGCVLTRCVLTRCCTATGCCITTRCGTSTRCCSPTGVPRCTSYSKVKYIYLLSYCNKPIAGGDLLLFYPS